jgi:hypothetical protein
MPIPFENGAIRESALILKQAAANVNSYQESVED